MTNEPSPSAPSEPVEHLESRQCWDLLRQVSVGRLAVWVDDHPDIFPLNYTVDHGTLVFRTDEGTKLSGALGETPVALEADGVDAVTGMAWSVVVKGKAAAVTGIEGVLDTASRGRPGRRTTLSASLPIRSREGASKSPRRSRGGPSSAAPSGLLPNRRRRPPGRRQASRVISTLTLSVEPPPPDRMPLSGGTSR